MGSTFRASLKSLSATMLQAHVCAWRACVCGVHLYRGASSRRSPRRLPQTAQQYVRCIKPNGVKKKVRVRYAKKSGEKL